MLKAIKSRVDFEKRIALTVKKIPKQVLDRCQWGHDDYSLKVENLPKAAIKPGSTKPGSTKPGSTKPGQMELEL